MIRAPAAPCWSSRCSTERREVINCRCKLTNSSFQLTHTECQFCVWLWLYDTLCVQNSSNRFERQQMIFFSSSFCQTSKWPAHAPERNARVQSEKNVQLDKFNYESAIDPHHRLRQHYGRWPMVTSAWPNVRLNVRLNVWPNVRSNVRPCVSGNNKVIATLPHKLSFPLDISWILSRAYSKGYFQKIIYNHASRI